ncbi:MAG: hypothetical protein O7I93_15260 [Gemmatimonadetes bacterium]|nr:hypothetical protein [Gemmatimonadota bacterium]
MNSRKALLLWTILLLGAAHADATAQLAREVATPANFIYFGLERSRIAEAEFLDTEAIVGAQLKYTWRELEPDRDRYELQPVLQDLAFLERHGKRLFIQLQDVSFEEAIVNVPDYLRNDPVFGGGVARQYAFEDDDESVPIAEGWVARRWDPAVRDRFVKLLSALGEVLDGRIEGLSLAETSIGFGESGELHPPGFSFESYLEGLKAIMTAAGDIFRESRVILYANFMPGEGLPRRDQGYLRRIYEHADRVGVGVGGPDLLPHRPWQQAHSYPLIAARAPHTVAGSAVQWGNLDDRNRETGERVTVDELYRFARDGLRLDYIFWGTQEPHYSDEILPYLRNLARGGER